MSISKEELSTVFRAAIDSRKKLYANTFALHFRWEKDNTGAARVEVPTSL